MFQYISDIIKNISPKQRLWALVVTLVTIVTITLGGDIINALSNSDKALENRIATLEEANKLLNSQNKNLQIIVIESQIQCTKDITEVRQQILDELNQLETQMKTSSQPMRLMRVDSSNSPVRTIQLPNESMMHIKTMKQKLQTQIDEGK